MSTNISPVATAPVDLSYERSIDGTARKEVSEPMSAFIDLVKLSEERAITPATVREDLQWALANMSSDQRKEVVSNLKEMALVTGGAEVGALLDKSLPDVEKESAKGVSIDRLMELLFALLMLLGKVSTERNVTAAKFGEIATKQIELSGQKMVSAANSNFGGAVSGLVLGATVSGVGFKQYSKGTSGQINNIRTNGRDVTNGRSMTVDLNNAARRQASPLAGKTAPERLKTLSGRDRNFDIQQNQAHLSGTEQSTLQQLENKINIQTTASESARRVREFEHGLEQNKGSAIMQMGHHFVPLATSSAGIAAASYNSESKVNEGQGNIATSVQQSEDKAGDRVKELVTKTFALISAAIEEANRNVGEMSRAIKA